MKLKILPLLIFLAAPCANAAFVISQLEGTSALGNAATGQSFTPSVGISPVPGTPPATIDLTGFSIWINGGTANAGNAALLNTAYLLIYDANPSGAANLIGSSTNFVDLNPTPAAGTELAWTYDNLTLNYTTTYFAVVASDSTGSLGIDDIGFAVQVSGNVYAGGVSLINNFATQSTTDAKFTATFVPEPSTALLGTLGMLALLRRRRN